VATAISAVRGTRDPREAGSAGTRCAVGGVLGVELRQVPLAAPCSQSDGRPADDPSKLHRVPAGNLVYANGCLAVADRQTLSVFVPPRLLLTKRKAEAERQPNSAAVLLQLARAQADAAQPQEALQTLQRVEGILGRKPKTSAMKKLLAQALTVKQHVLLLLAQRAVGTKRWQDAEEAFQQAATIPLPPRYRLHALLRAAQIWQDAGRRDRVQTIWELIQTEENLHTIPVIDRQGRPTSVVAHFEAPRRRVRDAPAPPLRAQLNETPSLPLSRTWHVRLDCDERLLGGWRTWDPELLLTGSSDGRINCRLRSSGVIHWTYRLPFAPCWAGCYRDTILAAGAEGVACLGCKNGQLLWHFPAPVTGRYPCASKDAVRVVLDPQPPKPLSAFRLVAGRLFFLQGQQRLFALNAATGAVLWERWAPDGPLHLPFPQGYFSTCYHVGAETVLLQTSGQHWLLDAATGQLLHKDADGRDLWQRPPLKLEEHTLCVVPDTRHVVLLDARTGQCLWRHRLPGITTGSGERPSVLGRGHLLLCVQPTNIGYFVQRLDCASGKALWPRPQLLNVKTVDSAAWDFDTAAVYTIEDDLLTARSLVDGAIRWRRKLPAAGGRVRCIGDYLAVWPQAFGTEMRFRFRSFLGTVQWDLGPLLAPEAVFPLSCHDPKTGQLVQRLNFRIASPIKTALAKQRLQEEGDQIWIVRTSSLLASEDGPVIHLDTPQPFVALGGDVWGLGALEADKTGSRP